MTNEGQILNSYWFEGESDPELIRRHWTGGASEKVQC